MAPTSEDPKVIIRVINFELVQLICSRYLNVTKDGHFALCASRGKNKNRMIIIIIIVVVNIIDPR